MPKYRGASPSQGGFAFGENGDIGRVDHDKIMLWLDRKIRGGLLQSAYPAISAADDLKRFPEDTHRQRHQWPGIYSRLLADPGAIAKLYDAAEKPAVDREPQTFVEWEAPIGRGFVDMLVTIRRAYVWADIGFYRRPNQKDEPEARVTLQTATRDDRCYFEVKTVGTTIGETIRQINAYKQIVGGSRWWVVRPPSDEWATILPQQNIEFLAYEP